ncbi:hypothetical protein ABB37_09563 [Leptomonas pyrrhocoris]|uniref:Uncharacterized protein n=1 Tax=Leptomonas pyrrhocoris TaxID=157538 RepID=A0A0M9FQL4_LEPPY|nr:hypothetical protein ABB37_09563 [Leptomonas pyrrhocoris]XP_015652433.1 hypothetical protein ABB37_09563 [Leptomonas pyrrhocoris]KPA73993.1 hypothetical protein ABB37_09563 [Leptomonas pyrrhocoris]KPA73994.1 hypothetical protein ABB37_09563 [Leptomonas pyrrhocoris]|eukprot:XP_015652432.1 hypothetical protein ABB37_09563 [Leptomonas pyrrhocoris]
MSHGVGPGLAAQQQRIADIKAAMRREKAVLGKPLSKQPSLSPSPSSPSARSPSPSTSSSSSEPALSAARAPLTWSRVQERMRMLHAWDAKCTVEAAAVRLLERETQQDMEASMGRKTALMEQLHHLCREEVLLKSSESALQGDLAALSDEREKLEVLRTASAKQLQSTAHSNLQRLQQLDDARQGFERRKALREKERQALREEVAELDGRAIDLEAKVAATVQRIADHERTARLVEANLHNSERSRVETLQREVGRLMSQLEVEES